VVPGYDRRILLIPLLPLAAWLASLGEGCWRNWVALGADGLVLRADWDCLPPAILIGIVPAIAMVVMLRRGAPLLPRVSIALGALAVAALANLGLRLFPVGDASVMVLFWHLGGAAVLAAVAALAGRRVLYWRHATAERGAVPASPPSSLPTTPPNPSPGSPPRAPRASPPRPP